MGNDFINSFITMGFYDLLENKNKNPFEKHIVECLCDIFGKKELMDCYKNNNQEQFVTILTSYGISKSTYETFLSHLLQYEKYKMEKSCGKIDKTDFLNIIETDLITMYIFKCLLSQIDADDLAHFENNLLNNFDIIKMHFNESVNPTSTREIWEQKKHVLLANIDLIEIKPEYLSNDIYKKFGTSLDDVQKMDYRMVDQLNSYINSRIEVDSKMPTPKKELNLKNVILTSGNGYVDALLIFSIIVTELSMGVIYYFLHI